MFVSGTVHVDTDSGKSDDRKHVDDILTTAETRWLIFWKFQLFYPGAMSDLTKMEVYNYFQGNYAKQMNPI